MPALQPALGPPFYPAMPTHFVLLTVARLPNGYRLVAATPCCADRYVWQLWRNHQAIAQLQTHSLANVVAVDLCAPIAPGNYHLSVDWISATRTNDHTARPPRLFSAQVWLPR